jgi:hypothetical protein
MQGAGPTSILTTCDTSAAVHYTSNPNGATLSDQLEYASGAGVSVFLDLEDETLDYMHEWWRLPPPLRAGRGGSREHTAWSGGPTRVGAWACTNPGVWPLGRAWRWVTALLLLVHSSGVRHAFARMVRFAARGRGDGRVVRLPPLPRP